MNKQLVRHQSPTLLERVGFRLTKRFHSSGNLNNPNVSLSDASTFGDMPSLFGANVTVKTALTISSVWAAVRVLTDAVAVLPNQTFERGEDGSKRRATGHHLYRLLKLRPNPVMTAYNFYEIMMLHLSTWGNFYAEKQFDGRGNVIALWPLRPDRTRPVLSDDGSTKNYVTHVDGRDVMLPGDRVTHTVGLGFDGLVGISVISLARRSLQLTAAAEDYGRGFFGSGARIAGVLTHPETLGPEGTKALRESWEFLYNGLTNPMRVAVLEEGMKFEKIGIPPEDAQFLGTREFQIAEVGRWFKVPAHLIGDMSKATFSNIEQQSLDFLRNTLLPWLRRIEMTLNHDVFPAADQDTFFAEFNIDAYLRGDSAARGALYKDLFAAGAIQPNEIRSMENMNPIEGGEQSFVPLNFVPLSVAKPLAALPLEDDPEPEPEPEPEDDNDRHLLAELLANQTARERRQANAVVMRERAAQAFLPLFLKEARAVLSDELAEARRQHTLAFGSRDATEFKAWIDSFYDTFGAEVSRRFASLLRSYGNVIFDAVGEEVGAVELTPELDRFLADYAEQFGQRWATQSRNELSKILRDSSPDDVADDITKRLDGWDVTRASKHSKEETYRASNAMARAAYGTLGVLVVRWTIQGATCPLCSSMSGRTVSTSGSFLERGDEVEPDDDSQEPLVIQSRVSHPPLHRGCDCILTASL